MIAAERRRQINVEGWSIEHDAAHEAGELAKAARSYINAGLVAQGGDALSFPPGREWPWEASWWKPSADPVRNLVKAGALIAAEIDRLQHRGSKGHD